MSLLAAEKPMAIRSFEQPRCMPSKLPMLEAGRGDNGKNPQTVGHSPHISAFVENAELCGID